MKRRSALKFFALSGLAGLSGCVNPGRVFGGDDSMKLVTIQGTDPDPSMNKIEIKVELERNSITSNNTARLKLSLQNQSSESIQIGDGHLPVFSGIVSTDDPSDPGLLLITPESNISKDPRCWKPLTSYSIPSVLNFQSLDPNEEASMEYEIWGQSDNNSSNCIPSGDYRFETEYHIRTGDQRIDAGEEGTFEWGFDLTISSS